jgi:hypothetical protein
MSQTRKIQPIKFNQVDLSKISYEKKTYTDKTKLGFRVLYKYNENMPPRDLQFQCPKVHVPFGASVPYGTTDTFEKYVQSENPKLSLQMSLNTDPRYDIKGEVAQFKTLLEGLDNTHAKYLSENSSKIFSSGQCSVDELRKFKKYFSQIKKYKGDKGYADTFKVKLPIPQDLSKLFTVCNDKNETVHIIKYQDENGNPLNKPVIDWSWITPGKGIDLVPVIRCAGIAIINDIAYCTWNVLGLKIYENESTSQKITFIDDDDDTVTESVAKLAISAPKEVVEEEEEEYEEEEE